MFGHERRGGGDTDFTVQAGPAETGSATDTEKLAAFPVTKKKSTRRKTKTEGISQLSYSPQKFYISEQRDVLKRHFDPLDRHLNGVSSLIIASP